MSKYALEKTDDSATVFKFQTKQNLFPLSHMLKFLYVGAVTLVNVPYKNTRETVRENLWTWTLMWAL